MLRKFICVLIKLSFAGADVKTAGSVRLPAAKNHIFRFPACRAMSSSHCAASQALNIKSQRNFHRFADFFHQLRRKRAYALPQAALIECADLLRQNHAILRKPIALRRHIHVRGQTCFAKLAGYGQYDHRGTIAVSHIVLYNEYWAYAPLLRTDDRVEAGAVQLPSCNHSFTLRIRQYLPHTMRAAHFACDGFAANSRITVQ